MNLILELSELLINIVLALIGHNFCRGLAYGAGHRLTARGKVIDGLAGAAAAANGAGLVIT